MRFGGGATNHIKASMLHPLKDIRDVLAEGPCILGKTVTQYPVASVQCSTQISRV